MNHKRAFRSILRAFLLPLIALPCLALPQAHSSMDIIDKIIRIEIAAICTGSKNFAPDASGTSHFLLGEFNRQKKLKSHYAL